MDSLTQLILGVFFLGFVLGLWVDFKIHTLITKFRNKK